MNEKDLESMKKKVDDKLQENFITGCYEGYDILTSMGEKALSKEDLPNIKKAINRMNTLFIMKEEYERCGWLKRFCEEHLPDHKIELDEEVQTKIIL
jgi:hypothetical protein